jgi:hypothetical protein
MVTLLVVACANFTMHPGASLQLDGRAVDISKSCTFSSTSNCEDTRVAPDAVWCNYPGSFGGRDILVLLEPPASIEVDAKHIIWTYGRETSRVALGGATGFQAAYGVDLNVSFPGNHHITGWIRC